MCKIQKKKLCTGSGRKIGHCIIGLLVALQPISSHAKSQTASVQVIKKKNADQSAAYRKPCSKRYKQLALDGGLASDQDPLSAITATFRPRRLWGVEENTSIVTTEVGDRVLRVQYPKGSLAPSRRDAPLGGAGFLSSVGMGENVERACLSYNVMFESGFKFSRGGKLPGLFGGENAPTGGARPKDDDGFSMRLMWREDGHGEIYGYFPNMEPISEHAGMAIGAGSWRFRRKRWTTIELEVVLNTPGKTNGIARLWIDDEIKIDARGIRYRDTQQLSIDGLIFSTFFGGRGDQFKSPRLSHAQFANFKIFVHPSDQLDRKDATEAGSTP